MFRWIKRMWALLQAWWLQQVIEGLQREIHEVEVELNEGLAHLHLHAAQTKWRIERSLRQAEEALEARHEHLEVRIEHLRKRCLLLVHHGRKLDWPPITKVIAPPAVVPQNPESILPSQQ